MADKIRINTDRLGTDAERIQGYIENIVKEMAGIRQNAAALESMWEGPGSSAFHKAFRDDMEIVAEAVRDMKSIYEYDADAKRKYEQCDRKISSMIAEIKMQE